jgi:hypothetical protein
LINLLAIIGLFIALGEILGLFRDTDKLEFVKILESQLECPKDHPGAKKFINDFIFTNPEYENMKIDETEIEKVIFVGLWVGKSDKEIGRQVESVSSGSLKLKALNGQVTNPLCSYGDLKNWLKESPVWKWLGWGIVATSVLLGIVLLFIEEMVKKKSAI